MIRINIFYNKLLYQIGFKNLAMDYQSVFKLTIIYLRKMSSRSTTYSISFTKPEIRLSIRNLITHSYLQFSILFLFDPIFGMLNLYTYTFNFKIDILTQFYMLRFFYQMIIIPINKAFSDINIIYISKFMDQRKVLVAQTHLLYAVIFKLILIILVTFILVIVNFNFLTSFIAQQKLLFILIKFTENLVLEETYTLLIIKNDKLAYFVFKITNNFIVSFSLLFYSLIMHAQNAETRLSVFIILESVPNIISSCFFVYYLIKKEKVFRLQIQLFSPFRYRLLLFILHKQLAKFLTYFDFNLLFFLSYYYPKKYSSVNLNVIQFQLIVANQIFLLLEPFFTSANLISLRYLQISSLKLKTNQVEEFLRIGIQYLLIILSILVSFVFLIIGSILNLFEKAFMTQNMFQTMSIRVLILSFSGNELFRLFHFVQSGLGNIKLVFIIYGVNFVCLIPIVLILCLSNKYVEFKESLYQFSVIKVVSALFGLYLTYKQNIESEVEREIQAKLLQAQNIKDIENMKNKIQLRNQTQNKTEVMIQESQSVVSPHTIETIINHTIGNQSYLDQ